MESDYQKICQDLLVDLDEKQKEVISRRFGLGQEKRETLESIGQSFGISRERVRQIQEFSFGKIKPRAGKYKTIFQSFLEYFKKFGGLRKEDIVLADLGKGKWQNEAYFLLTLKEPFQKLSQTADFYALWLADQASFQKAKGVIGSLCKKLEETKRPLKLKEIAATFLSLNEPVLSSYLDISKKIQKNKEAFYGLKEWPEINPRGVKDKAYLAFKKTGKPLHFVQVANLIEGSHVQTVHNELIRDARFVLVGRGMYALREWGYEPGEVKEVISKILKDRGAPLTKEEILKNVFSQRLVKENTVLLNLSNKKYFLRDSQGKYWVKEA